MRSDAIFHQNEENNNEKIDYEKRPYFNNYELVAKYYVTAIIKENEGGLVKRKISNRAMEGFDLGIKFYALLHFFPDA